MKQNKKTGMMKKNNNTKERRKVFELLRTVALSMDQITASLLVITPANTDHISRDCLSH